MKRTRNREWKPRRGLGLAMRRSALLWWTATAGLALLTMSVVTTSLGAATRGADAWGRERSVWVVERSIGAGARVDAASVRRTLVPRGVIPVGALDGTASPIGDATRVALSPGEIVLRSRLAAGGAQGVAAIVRGGYRGLALPYDDQMAPVRVGDRIDVIATFDVGDAEGGDAPSVAVARNVEVVSVRSRAVTVAVPVDDATRVAFALAKGVVTIALRGAGAASAA